MLNEQKEFEAYTGKVSYTAANKHDTTYLGRFTFDGIIHHEGLVRVFTILARGFLWSSNCDTEYTYRALCAWCSIPDKKNAKPKEDWQYKSDFREFHDEFPNLVDKQGRGWFYHHAHTVADFIMNNLDKVYHGADKQADIINRSWDNNWRKKVVKFQIPLFSKNTEGGFHLLFDDVIADALEQGPLRDTEITLPQNIVDRIAEEAPKIKTEWISTLICYYIQNKQPDSDWVILPASNFDAYFGTTTFSHKKLNTIPQTIIFRDRQVCGLTRYKVMPEFLPQEEVSDTF